MGSRGPAPKRESQRRRRNKKDQPTTTAAGAAAVKAPAADRSWHPVAKWWYQSLAKSGQSQFYEPSDWALAQVVAESMSRDLKPRQVLSKDGSIYEVVQPINGTSMASYLKAMSSLLVTEADRRRALIELERPTGSEEGDDADVSELSEYRNRLRSS